MPKQNLVIYVARRTPYLSTITDFVNETTLGHAVGKFVLGYRIYTVYTISIRLGLDCLYGGLDSVHFVINRVYCDTMTTVGMTHFYSYQIHSVRLFFFFFFRLFSHQGSPQRIFRIQLLLSSVSSSVTSTSVRSSFTTSINLLFGLLRFLFPGNSILSTLLPIYPSSFLSTCPYHLSPPLVFSLQTVPPVLSL